MVLLPYNYRGVPIGFNARRGRRMPVRPNRGKSWKTVLIIAVALALIVYGVCYLCQEDDAETQQTAEQKTEEKQTVPPRTVPEPAGIESTPVVAAGIKQPERPVVQEHPAAAPAAVLSQTDTAAESEIRRLMKDGRHGEAREKLEKILLPMETDNPFYAQAQQLLAMCSEVLRRNGAFTPETIEYTVKPGDALSRIARSHGVSTADIVDASGMENPNMLKVGQTLKIPKNTWRAEIFVKKQKLFVYEKNRLVRIYSLSLPAVLPSADSFRVGTGTQAWKIYGLGISDIKSVRTLLPVGTIVRISK